MKNNFRVIIAGSRAFKDYALLKSTLDYMLSNKSMNCNIIIISGTAHGADLLGELYAKEKGYKIEQYPADWSIGKVAGYARNCDMANVADACIIFNVDHSKGSTHMENIAINKNIPTEVIHC